MNLQDAQNAVLEFHAKHGLRTGGAGPRTLTTRATLIREEADEVDRAIAALKIHPDEPAKIAELAKELADLVYVVFGAAVELGINLGDAFHAVHESNMTKDGGSRPDGKILKGDGYIEPDMLAVLGFKPSVEQTIRRWFFSPVAHSDDTDKAIGVLTDMLLASGHLK